MKRRYYLLLVFSGIHFVAFAGEPDWKKEERADEIFAWEEHLEQLKYERLKNPHPNAQKSYDDLERVMQDKIIELSDQIEDEKPQGFFKKIFGGAKHSILLMDGVDDAVEVEALKKVIGSETLDAIDFDEL